MGDGLSVAGPIIARFSVGVEFTGYTMILLRKVVFSSGGVITQEGLLTTKFV